MATAKEVYDGVRYYADFPEWRFDNWDCHHGALLGMLTQAVKDVLPAEKSYRLIIGYFYGDASQKVEPLSSKGLTKAQWYGLNKWVYGGKPFLRPEFSTEAKDIASRILTSITVGTPIRLTLDGEIAYWAQLELGGVIKEVADE